MKYETEEQQLEAIKDWWKQNANMVIGFETVTKKLVRKSL